GLSEGETGVHAQSPVRVRESSAEECCTPLISRHFAQAKTQLSPLFLCPCNITETPPAFVMVILSSFFPRQFRLEAVGAGMLERWLSNPSYLSSTPLLGYLNASQPIRRRGSGPDSMCPRQSSWRSSRPRRRP